MSDAHEQSRHELRQRIASDRVALHAAVDDLRTAAIRGILPAPRRPALWLGGAFLFGFWLAFRRNGGLPGSHTRR